MIFKKTCFLVWTALFPVVLGYIHLTGESANQDVQEGETLDVFCQGAIAPGSQVFWQNSQQTFHQDGKNLQISQVTRNFTGEYSCIEQIPDTGETKEIFNVFVNVIYPAKILSTDMTNDTEHGKETVSVTVNVEGNPLPDIKVTQLSTGKEIYTGTKDGTVTISFTVDCLDTGTYILTCSNSLNYDSVRVNITKLCIAMPDPNFPITISPRVGDSASLSAHIIGYPPPTFQWLQGGIDLASHNDTSSSSVLTIDPVTAQNFQSITLMMSNSVGTSTIEYYIIAHGPPEPVTNLQVSAITQYGATLTWTSGYDYNQTQTFVVLNTINGNTKEIGTVLDNQNDLGNISITRDWAGLEQFTNYNISILSRNGDGNSAHASNSIPFMTYGAPSPDPKKHIQYTYTPRLGEKVFLQMFSIGNPPPTFTWQHGDQPVNHTDSEQSSGVDLADITPEQFGTYSCTLENAAGISTSTFTVVADGPPEAASDLAVGTVTPDSVQLSWTAGFDYENIQTFTIVQHQDNAYKDLDTVPAADHSMGRVTHYLTQLTSDTPYTVQIKSSNERGSAANLSNIAQFSTAAFPTATPAQSGVCKATLSVSVAFLWSFLVQLTS